MKLKRSVAIFHVIFLVTGVATVMMGVLLAHAANGDSDSGALMSVQFSGQVVGSLVVTQKPHRTLMFGLVLSVLASALLGILVKPVELVMFLLGLGLGSVMSSVNTAAGLEVAPEKRASVLELLNVFWPLGAAAAPWVGGIFHGSFRAYELIAALFIPCLIWLSVTEPGQAVLVERQEAAERVVGWGLLCNLCFIAFLVVGVETAVASWLPTLAQRDGASAALAVAIPAGYWCGSLASRLVASVVLRRVPLFRLSAVAAVGTVLASALVPFAVEPAMLLGAAVAMAVMIAPLFPALLAGCVHVRGKGLIFMSSGLGSAAAPWLVGRVSGAVGSLHRAEWVAAAGALVMVVAMTTAGMFRRPVD